MNFDMQYETVKEHYLETVEITDKTQTFCLRRQPDSMMMSTIITFTHGRIIVFGDLSPGRYGVISCGGYGLGWFGGSVLSPSYLAEKFLDKCYEGERAEEEAKDYLKERAQEAWEWRDFRIISRARKLRDLIEDEKGWMFENAQTLYDSLSASKFHSDLCDDGIPWGWGYPTGDYCWLAAIQKRFSEVYQEWIKTDEGLEFVEEKK